MLVLYVASTRQDAHPVRSPYSARSSSYTEPLLGEKLVEVRFSPLVLLFILGCLGDGRAALTNCVVDPPLRCRNLLAFFLKPILADGVHPNCRGTRRLGAAGGGLTLVRRTRRGSRACELATATTTTAHARRGRQYRPFQCAKLTLVLVVWQPHVFAESDEVAQALDILWVLFVDLLIELKRLLKGVHATVATCDHEAPFDLGRLDLGGALEELDGLLVQLILDIPDAEPRDDVEVDGIVSVALVMKVQRLVFVVILVEYLAHPRKDVWIGRDARDEDVEPLGSRAKVEEQIVEIGDLIDHLWRVGDDRVQLLKRLQRFLKVAHALVDQAKVVDGLGAIRLDSDGLKVQLPRALELALGK
mmetsp:Transcript_17169/g.54601  ORF Transcript_17169/g.54601 Transcript_17169/m.54601 type:complete len:360 (-) Transcript_17169:611-1690(-)